MAFGDLINRQTSQTPNGYAMNVPQILNKTITLVTPSMHVTRRKSPLACMTSILHGANATVTSIGRGISSSAGEKHNIKRADRLLSNSHLYIELSGIYGFMGRLFTAALSTPVIHVDWSDLDEYKRHFLLRASLAFEGRSITLYEEVHDIGTKEKPATHRHFLDVLKSILPPGSTPVIVTDAGFKTPWFNTVLSLGWHFVGRARKPNFFHINDENWQCITSLYPAATSCPKTFAGQLCRSSPMDVRFVLYKQNPKGRHKLNRSGTSCLKGPSQKGAKRNREPWLLVTSLPDKSHLGKRVVKIYQTRMQIEETFRDMKSPRFALGFSNNLSKDTRRLRILVLLTTLAHLVATLTGWTVKMANKHRRYQANSLKNRDVLKLKLAEVNYVPI
ncbi:IS4 family transposase [Paraneptunicella aestuarii]|uniref:IS4 family transposase n=1 Tax=Paraneptunicella aestuarii TaxID=2831148 RepID=UPI001E3B3FA0|nr:IS4 family transposase [Paraneptunicella aestuarii]UAA37224.1 IS4 family transposase [Paraneptunicella aestuarii]UAA37225.1 IS4 family transposase [Paraneptunicella aestuarii]